MVWEQYGQPDTATHCVNFVSEYITTLTGYSIEDWLTTPDFWLVVMHPDDRDQAARTAVENFSNGKGGTQQFRWITKQGRTLWVESTYSVIFDDKEVPTGFRGVTIDITERKQIDETLRDVLQKLALHFQQTPLAYVEWNHKTEVAEWNPAAEKVFGYPRDEAIGRHYSFLVPSGALPYTRRIEAALFSHQGGQRSTNENLTRDGRTILCEWYNTAIVNNQGNVIAIASLAQDITERVRQEQKIARLSRIRGVLSAVNSVIIRTQDRLDLFKEATRIAIEQGHFKMAWIAEIDLVTLAGKPVVWEGFDDGYMDKVRVTARPDVPEAVRPSNRAVRTKQPVVCNDVQTDPSMEAIRQDALARGYRSLIALPLLVGDKVVAVMVLYAEEAGFFDEEELGVLAEMAADLSFSLDYIEKKKQIDYLAYYDVLTGLPNSGLLHDRIGQFARTSSRTRTSFAVIVLDLERLRRVNDTLGLQAGDALIGLVADRLRGVIRDSDNLARIKEGHFVIVQSYHEDEGDVVRFLRDRIFSQLSRPFEVAGQQLRIAVKAGVSVFPSDGQEAEALLKNAQAALLQAKKASEAFLFYAPGMNARVARDLSLENKLRSALERYEFVLHYQPKVELESNRITGVEALIRWNDPDSGLVPPAEFIPLLEETGLILEVGRWVLEKIASDRASWVQKGLPPLRIAANVSPIQLRQKTFVNEVAKVLDRLGPAGKVLDLEITESTLMQDRESNISKLRALQEMGINIALDDFGTGYSSLSYMAELPINVIKIDRSFIRQMTTSSVHRAIVSSIVALAKGLGLQVVAEGVESKEQAEILRLLKCDEVQGYLFSRPVPTEELEAIIIRAS